MSDIFAEVEEDLRAERARKLLQRYGGVLVAAAVVVVLAVGGWQFWRNHQAKEAARVAQLYLDATKAGVDRNAALAGLAQVAGQGGAGYRALARLREAALRFDAGEKDAALALWDQVSSDSAADPLLRDFGGLMWVWHQIDSGDTKALTARLVPLSAGPWRPLAQEAQALIDLRDGQTEAARNLLKGLSQDPKAPDGVRARAGGLLAQIGA